MLQYVKKNLTERKEQAWGKAKKLQSWVMEVEVTGGI